MLPSHLMGTVDRESPANRLMLRLSSNADSVLELEDKSTVFVKPYECDMSFESVADYIAEQETRGRDGTSRSTQNKT